MPKAVIFDMDGVLVDSEKIGLKAAQIAFAKYGAKVKNSDVLPYLGAGTRAYVAALAKKYKIKKDIDELIQERFDVYTRLIKKEGLPRKEGAFRLLKDAKKKRLKTALASASSYHKIRLNMSAAKIPIRLFDAIVSGTRVKHFKPYPDIFLEAARRLNVKPSDCIVIEDATNGVVAGKRAGMKTVAVLGTFPASKLKKAGADMVVSQTKLSKILGK